MSRSSTSHLEASGHTASRRLFGTALGGAPKSRFWASGIVAGGLLALLLVLLYTRLFAILPGYPAVLMVFLVWAVVPGLLLQRALFGTRALGLFERLTVAFVLSMALASAPGLLALRLHWSLQTFAALYAVVAAVVSGLSLLWHRQEDDAPAVGEADSAFPAGPLMLIVGVSLVAVLTSPIWGGDRIPRDADDWVYMAYVNEYASTDALDASKPFPTEGAYGRMAINVWVVVESLLADNAGVEPFDLLMDYLPPLMTVLAMAAMFTLAKSLFRSTPVALLAAGFVLAYGALDLSPHEGYGRNIFLRIAQDKMVATYILLPVGLLLVSSFLSRQTAGSYLALVLTVLALFIVHPMGVVFLGIASAFLVAARVLVERSLVQLRGGALLLFPWGVLALGFLLRSWLVDAVASDPSGTGFLFRRDFRLVELAHGLVMGNYHLLLHPFMLASVLLAPLVWLKARRNIGNQVILATVMGVLIVFFVPLLATLLTKAVSGQGLWRLPQLVPVPLILAYACNEAVTRLLSRRNGKLALTGPGLAVGKALASTGAVMLVVGGALFVQEHYGVLDKGAYYQRFSSTKVLPWTEGSIFLGGVEHASLTNARPSPAERGLMEYLRANVPPGSTVLAPPPISRSFPGMLDGIRRVDYSGALDFPERRAMVTAFYSGSLWGPDLRNALERYGVDFAVGVVEKDTEDTYYVHSAGSGMGPLLWPDDHADQPNETVYLRSFYADDFLAASGSPALGTHGSSWEKYDAWEFDGRTLEVISLKGGFRIPEDAADGELTFKLQFAPSVDSPSGAVKWGVWTPSEGEIAIGDNYDYEANGDIDEATYTYAGFQTAGERQEITITTTTSASFAAGNLVRFAIVRRGNARADTNTNDAWLLQVDVYYVRDKSTRGDDG